MDKQKSPPVRTDGPFHRSMGLFHCHSVWYSMVRSGSVGSSPWRKEMMIDAESEEATTELLSYLDDLDNTFRTFAELDFTAEFDYLENLAG